MAALAFQRPGNPEYTKDDASLESNRGSRLIGTFFADIENRQMAIVRNNPFLMGVSGSIGKQITIRQLAGQTVVSKYRGPSSVPATDAQLTVRARFAKAVAYARQAKKDQRLASLYEAAASLGNSAYHLALRDALSAPTISEIRCQQRKGTVTVTATDIVEVRMVVVSLRNAQGMLLQEGHARRKPGTDEWVCRISKKQSRQAGNLITAMAWDYPANSSMLSMSTGRYACTGVRPPTNLESDQQQTKSANTKPSLNVAYIKYIEEKAREPDGGKQIPHCVYKIWY